MAGQGWEPWQGACSSPWKWRANIPWSLLARFLGRMSADFGMKDLRKAKFPSLGLLFVFSEWLCLKASKEVCTDGFAMLSLALHEQFKPEWGSTQIGIKVPLHNHTLPDQFLSCQELSWSSVRVRASRNWSHPFLVWQSLSELWWTAAPQLTCYTGNFQSTSAVCAYQGIPEIPVYTNIKIP